MLNKKSVIRFGKYKGFTVFSVLSSDPGYLCWLRKTGFSDFGKEVTEAIWEWEEKNPAEVSKIDASIERKRLQDEQKEADRIASHAPIEPPKHDASASTHASWGMW